MGEFTRYRLYIVPNCLFDSAALEWLGSGNVPPIGGRFKDYIHLIHRYTLSGYSAAAAA